MGDKKILGLAIKRAYHEWWDRLTRDGDPMHVHYPTVTEVFVAGWNAGVAKAASVASAHSHLDEECVDAQDCCEVIAVSIGDLIERVEP